MKNIQNISVDITARNTNPPPIVTAKQFDNTSRQVIATIYDNGVLASVPSTAAISVYFGGIKGNDTCYIDGLTATDSKVEFVIPQTALLMFGEVPCEIQISENDEIIATMNFFIKVEKSVYSDDAAVGEDNGNVIIPAIEALKKAEALEYKFDEESQKTSALQNFPRIVEMNVEDSGTFTVQLISGEVTPTFSTLTCDIDMTRLNNAAYLVKYKRPDSSWLLVDGTAIQSSQYDPANYTHYRIADFVIDTTNSKIINYYPHYLSGSFSKLDSYIGNKANIPYGIELRIVDDTNVKVRYFLNDLRNGTAELIVKSININTFFSSGLSAENDVYFWYANNKWVIGDSQAYVGDDGLPIYDKFHIASVFVKNGKVTDFIAYYGMNAKTYTDKQDLALGQRIDDLQTNKAEQSQVDSIAEGLTNKTASNTKDHNTFISDLNYTGSTAERIAFTVLNKRISTNGSTGTVVDLNGVADPTYNCTIIDCNADDYFYVNALGGAMPRAWAFIDKDNKLISKSNGDVEYHGELKAPTNAKKLIVNTKCKEFYCYKGRTLKNRIAANETEITSIKNSYATKSYVSGGYLKQTDASNTYLTKTTANSAYLTKSAARSTYVPIDKFPSVKGTKSGESYVIEDISALNTNLKITRAGSYVPWVFTSGKNLIYEAKLEFVYGTTISGTWSSDILSSYLVGSTTLFKLVVNGKLFSYSEAIFDVASATIEFYRDGKLLGSTSVSMDTGTFRAGSYAYNPIANTGADGIKIILNNINLQLDSLMVTLSICTNDYEPYQTYYIWRFDDTGVLYLNDLNLYPTTLIINDPDMVTTTEYDRDIGTVLNELIGDVNTALDSAIQIQNNYIGSDS